ncbi:MAG: DUF6263 family protein [Flavobacteriales bacterium]|nr:DUF6263 family protein [Flavobacteriales bacterium]
MGDSLDVKVDTDSSVVPHLSAKGAKELDSTLRSFVGKAYEVLFTPSGKIVHTNISPLLQSQGVNVPGLWGGSSAGEALTPEFPENTIRVGDPWEVKKDYALGEMGLVNLKLTYTLISVQDSMAEIIYQGLMSPSQEIMKISGNMEGKILLDLKNGFEKIEESRYSADISMNFLGMETRMKQEGTVESQIRK